MTSKHDKGVQSHQILAVVAVVQETVMLQKRAVSMDTIHTSSILKLALG